MTEKELAAEHRLLGNRSSKILGGYVTERLLTDTFMSPGLLYTKSWWFSKTTDKQVFWFVEKPQLTRLDLEISALLESRDERCYQLYREDGPELDATRWRIRKVGGKKARTVQEFVEKHSLEPIRKVPPKPVDSAHEQEMLTKCVEHYRASGMLRDIRRSIQIEDLFLNRYFYTSNIDLFLAEDTESALKPACLEIKFKDPFLQDGQAVFGLDKYQLRDEYRRLEEAGMNIYMVVLHNSCRDRRHVESTGIFHYLETVQRHEWLYARISHNAKYPEYRMTSTKTGFTGAGKKSRPVFCVPKENFDELESLRDLLATDKLLDGDGTPVKLCPACGRRLVIREGRYGAFFGCKGYPACKYTQNI